MAKVDLPFPVKPVGDRILYRLREEGETKTKAGIIIPEPPDIKKTQRIADVAAVGPGRLVKKGPHAGKVIPHDVKPGDTVIVGLYAGRRIHELDSHGNFRMAENRDAILSVIEE